MALNFAWAELHRLRRCIGAQKLIATVGNHDVVSRGGNQGERPEDELRRLSPRFPISESAPSNRFWRDGFFIRKYPAYDTTLCVVNTCILHGLAAPAAGQEEWRRGRLNNDTILQLRLQLPQSLSTVNILVMHHHIRQHPWLPDEVSHVYNGPALVEILKDTGRRWFVIHGHQHLPDFRYVDASHRSPIVLSSASVAAQTYQVNGRRPSNQMHLVTFDDELIGQTPGELFGTIQTWTWAQGVGWTPGSARDGLPHLSGFGRQGALGALAQTVAARVDASENRRMTWEELARGEPAVVQLTPDDMNDFIEELERRQMAVAYNRYQYPHQVERRIQ
jgi:hypothetical protein